jgi:DNA topoisomerase-1
MSSYVEGSLLLEVKKEVESELREDLAGLKPEEAAVLSLLEARLNRDLNAALNESIAAIDGARAGARA